MVGEDPVTFQIRGAALRDNTIGRGTVVESFLLTEGLMLF